MQSCGGFLELAKGVFMTARFSYCHRQVAVCDRNFFEGKGLGLIRIYVTDRVREAEVLILGFFVMGSWRYDGYFGCVFLGKRGLCHIGYGRCPARIAAESSLAHLAALRGTWPRGNFISIYQIFPCQVVRNLYL